MFGLRQDLLQMCCSVKKTTVTTVWPIKTTGTRSWLVRKVQNETVLHEAQVQILTTVSKHQIIITHNSVDHLELCFACCDLWSFLSHYGFASNYVLCPYL